MSYPNCGGPASNKDEWLRGVGPGCMEVEQKEVDSVWKAAHWRGLTIGHKWLITRELRIAQRAMHTIAARGGQRREQWYAQRS